MSRLKVLLRGALISEVQLNPEIEYIGGRKEGCDIRLQAEKGISREHFKLKFQDGHWNIQAVSRFGDVFSLGQKVETAILEHGQSFQIPPYEFQLLDVPESDVPAESDAAAQEISESEKTVIGAVPQMPYIKMVNTRGEIREMLRLEVGDLWVAGRDPSCQIIIPDQRVSRRQFELHKVNGIYTVLDLASVNGTFLNGSPISSTDPQTLKSGDVITVLDNTMYFELHDPNFRYKVDKIEVPPMQMNQPEEVQLPEFENDGVVEEVADGEYQVPEIAQEGGYSQQYSTEGGPFTGMPPEQDPNQYYTMAPPAEEIPLTPMQKFMKNKPLVAAVAILFLGLMYYISENMREPSPVEVKQVVSNDPFSKLTPQNQKEVEENYTIAEQMMTQQKFDLALEKLAKIHLLVKEGYKDSKRMEDEANQSLLIITQNQKDEEARKADEERQKTIVDVTAKCEKLLNPEITMDQMTECLAPIVLIDATHPDYVRLIAEVEKIVSDRRTKEIEKQTLESQIKDLKDMFARAEQTQAAGFAFKSIKQYQEVENSTLPDPGKLKGKAKSRIAFIQSKITDKSSKGISQADVLYQEGKIKESIASLRESLVYDPDNEQIQNKINSYINELRLKMQAIYQESIIDESYGMVESTENKQGAKDKWKKIVELDIEDGEYYKKAIIKLRKYGIM